MRKIIVRVEDRGNGISISAGHKSDDGANHVEEIVAYFVADLIQKTIDENSEDITGLGYVASETGKDCDNCSKKDQCEEEKNKDNN